MARDKPSRIVKDAGEWLVFMDFVSKIEHRGMDRKKKYVVWFFKMQCPTGDTITKFLLAKFWSNLRSSYLHYDVAYTSNIFNFIWRQD